MIIERLQAFRRRSNVLPKRMIIFRDGVSEVTIPSLITTIPTDLQRNHARRANTTR